MNSNKLLKMKQRKYFISRTFKFVLIYERHKRRKMSLRAAPLRQEFHVIAAYVGTCYRNYAFQGGVQPRCARRCHASRLRCITSFKSGAAAQLLSR